MKSAGLPRRTVTKILWLSFGLVIFVLAIATLVYYWQVQRIDSDVAEMVEVQEPLQATVWEMQISAATMERVLSDYIQSRDPAGAEKARDAEADLKTAVVEFNDLAPTGEARTVGQEIAGFYEEFEGSAYEIRTLADQRFAILLSFRENAEGINELISGMLLATIDETPPDAMTKLEAMLNMQVSLRDAATATEAYAVEPDSDLPPEVLEAQTEFRRSATMYGDTSPSMYEEAWLDHVGEEFEEMASDGVEIISITDSLHGLLGRFEQSLGELNAYLDDQALPFVEAQAVEAAEDVQASSNGATRWLLILGVVGVLIGGVSVLAISRRIVTPIRDLTEGAKLVGSGKIEHRFNIDAKGEFGQLAFALNQMLQNLERSRNALWESEEMAWALLDATSDAVILTDPRGVILASNEIAAARYGKSLEQMIDVSIYDLLPPEATASIKSHMAEVTRTGKPVHFEDEREGKIIDQSIYPVLGTKGDISRMAIFAHDITVRKWVEGAIEQLGRRNEFILEAAGEGIYGLDTQGRTTFVNPAAAQMLGYKPDDLIGQRHHEAVHHSKPDGKLYPHDQCPIYATLKDGSIHSSVDDEVFWRKDGTCFPVDYTSTPIIQDGRIVGAVVTFRDITDRKRVEKALRQSEEKYRSIFEAATSLIVSVDREGVIVDCNNRIGQLLGYAPSEVVGRGLVELVHPDGREEVEEFLRETLAKGSKYNNRCRMVRKDGTAIDVNINAAAAKDANGDYVRTICMIDEAVQRVPK